MWHGFLSHLMRRRAGTGAAIVDLARWATLTDYRRDIRDIRKRVRGGATIALTRSGPIEYASEGAGVPALISHGAAGGYDQGLLLARWFAPPGVRAIAPSRFGYLGTPLPEDCSPTAQADAHAALLDALAIDSAIVVGASAGAPSAVELALNYRERVCALILPVPRGYAPNAPELPLSRSKRVLLRLLLSSDLAYWSALRLAGDGLVRRFGVPPDLMARASDAERNRIRAMMRGALPILPRLPGLRNDARTRLKPLPLEKVDVPTLIIAARDDLVGTLPAAQIMAARIPGARLVVIDSGGHLLVDRQREIAACIAEFMATVTGAKEGPAGEPAASRSA
jgi:2-hydroxy-6-oxonona-2,4-dienedioate hydrolase